MLLRVWTGEQYRPTKDLDLLAILDKSPEELDQIFRDVCTRYRAATFSSRQL